MSKLTVTEVTKGGKITYTQYHQCELPPVTYPLGALFVCDVCKDRYGLVQDPPFGKVAYFWKRDA